MAPTRYRAGQRVAAALEHLRCQPQITDREVAERLGFADAFHLSRSFKRSTGQTPGRWRAVVG